MKETAENLKKCKERNGEESKQQQKLVLRGCLLTKRKKERDHEMSNVENKRVMLTVTELNVHNNNVSPLSYAKLRETAAYWMVLFRGGKEDCAFIFRYLHIYLFMSEN